MTNKDLIDRLKNLKNRTSKEYEWMGESQRSYDKGQIDILEEILTLPTFSPEAIIEEMIEESKTQWEGFGYDSGTLEEVLSRIRAENIS